MEQRKALSRDLKRMFPLGIRDAITTLIILFFASLICFLLQTISTTDSHVPLIFVLAVLLTSLLTQGYAYGLLASLVSVFGVNYAFTYPYFAFNFTMTGYPLTFIITFTVSVITCTLTTRVRQSEQIRIDAEKEKMRANLLRSISHDFRTPLTSIMGSIDVVLENTGSLSDEQRRSLLLEAHSEAQWLINMVENLLSITRIGGNNRQAELHKELQAVEEVVGEAVLRFRHQYPDILLSVKIPDELLMVPMDAVLIEQLLMNLLVNAAEHGEQVTKIEVTVTKLEEAVRFCVSDDGVGIDRKILPDLFRMPVGDRGSETRRIMGIGLTVCKAIADAHGGDMSAENRSDGGASVSFTLPRSPDGMEV